jgi:hypothetical protein
MRKAWHLLLLTLAIFGMNCNYIQYKYTYTTNMAPLTTVTKRFVPIYVDKTFSTDDKLAIDNAVNQWNYVLNKQIILKVVSYDFDMEPELIKKAQLEHGWLFLKVNNDNLTIPDDLPLQQCLHTVGCKPTLAWSDRVGGSVVKVVKDRVSTEHMETVMLHEIGHLLYLAHDKDDINSLMYPNYNKLRYLCVDHNSVVKVATYYNLDITTMNYCLARY